MVEMPDEDNQFAQLLEQYDIAVRGGLKESFWLSANCSEQLRKRVEKAHDGLLKLDDYISAQAISTGFNQVFTTQLVEAIGQLSHVNRFKIIREVGRGGFGVVYLAIDSMLSREVAIKIPRIEMLGNPGIQQRFEKEAEIAASLDHPNIVPLFEVGQAGDNIYIVSLYCPGETLAGYMDQKKELLNIEQKVELIRSVCEAMDYCHRRGILHRDIKPSNILLFPEPSGSLPFTPRITDFGLAKVTESALADTASSAMIGTPLYMAPEQARSEFGKICAATDVYGIGVLLYEVLTGRPPFQGTMTEILDKIRHMSPEPLRALNPAVAINLETICLKCLSKTPQDRYQNAGELLADIRAFENGAPIKALRPSRWKRTWQSAIDSRAKVSLLALLVVVSVVLLTALSLPRGKREDSTKIALERSDFDSLNARYAIDLKKAYSLWQFAKPDEASSLVATLSNFAPDAYTYRFSWRFLIERLNRRQLDYLGLPGPLLCAAMSPDMRLIVGADRLGNIAIWETGNTKPVRQFNYSGKEVCDIAFSPDGTLVATTGQDSMVHVWKPNSWEELMVFHEPGGTNTAIDWSPDGTKIISGNRGKKVSVWNVQNGQRISRLEPVEEVVRNVAWSKDGKYVAANISGKCRVWKAEDWSVHCEHSFWYEEDEEEDSLYALCFSSDSGYLYTGGKSRLIHAIDLLRPDREPKSYSSRSELFSLFTSKNAPLIVSGLRRGGPRIWSDSTYSELVTIEESSSIHRTVDISEDGRYLLSASEDDSRISTWKLFDILGFEEIASGKGLLCQHSSSNVTMYVRTDEDTSIQFLEPRNQTLTIPGPSRCATLSKQGQILARLTESAMEVWSLPECVKVYSVDLEEIDVDELTLSSDGVHLLGSGDRSGWMLFNLEKKSLTLRNPSNLIEPPVNRFSADGQKLVALRYPRHSNQEVRFEIRSTDDGQVVHAVDDIRSSESIVADKGFTKLYLAQSSGIVVYDLATSKSDYTHFRSRHGIERITISPDDSTIAAWVKDEGLFLWDVPSGQELFCILSTTAIVDQLEFTCDSVLQCRTKTGDQFRLLNFRVSASNLQTSR